MIRSMGRDANTSRMAPRASAIVRAKDEGPTIERTLSLLRQQTVEPEIVVVDSGSTDGTVEIARRWCDRLIEIEPSQFSYGRALNIGAGEASAPFHFSISAHCFPERPDWIARCLAHYEDPWVAATGGAEYFPDGRSIEKAFYQDALHARTHPHWGFSNHASSWRKSVWEEFPFDEKLDYAEDREWAIRVTEAGWLIALDPALSIDMSHTWREGFGGLYRRHKRAELAFAEFANSRPYRVHDALVEWWTDIPRDGRSAAFHRLLNPYRVTAILGKHSGNRTARHRLG